MPAQDANQNRYALDDEVDRLASQVVAAIAKAGDGEPDFGSLQVQKSRKIATLAMKADANNTETRFRPGSRLRTYTGVRNSDGTLQDETYAGEAYLTDQSTIYRNIHPIRYDQQDRDPRKRGRPITGHFEGDGSFVEDIAASEILYNEYATENPDHPKSKYGIEPKPGVWTQGLAQIPSYLVQIPLTKGEVLVRAGGGKLISVRGGDFLVIDALPGGKIGVHAIDRADRERTYRNWDSSDL